MQKNKAKLSSSVQFENKAGQTLCFITEQSTTFHALTVSEHNYMNSSFNLNNSLLRLRHQEIANSLVILLFKQI